MAPLGVSSKHEIYSLGRVAAPRGIQGAYTGVQDQLLRCPGYRVLLTGQHKRYVYTSWGRREDAKRTLPKASNDAFENVLPRQIPTVTCFVANLPEGTPFRISLHSWETPTVSSGSLQSAAQFGSPVTFEARVLVDEICVG